MPPDNIRHSDEEPTAPARLVAALKSQRREPIAVPRSVDETILRAAGEHLRIATSRRSERGLTAAVQERPLVVVGRPAAKRFNWLKFAPWAAAAATLTAAALLVRVAIGPPVRENAEDLNHDGQVDMLDAFILARQVQQGAKPGARLDLNGDGVVDEGDAEVLAAHAVSLEKARKS